MQGFNFILRYITFILACDQMIHQLVSRASGDATILNILLEVEPPVSLCNIRSQRNSSPSDLSREIVSLTIRKSAYKNIQPPTDISPDLPYLQVLKCPDGTRSVSASYH
jgi:hypothetical protein